MAYWKKKNDWKTHKKALAQETDNRIRDAMGRAGAVSAAVGGGPALAPAPGVGPRPAGSGARPAGSGAAPASTPAPVHTAAPVQTPSPLLALRRKRQRTVDAGDALAKAGGGSAAAGVGSAPVQAPAAAQAAAKKPRAVETGDALGKTEAGSAAVGGGPASLLPAVANGDGGSVPGETGVTGTNASNEPAGGGHVPAGGHACEEKENAERGSAPPSPASSSSDLEDATFGDSLKFKRVPRAPEVTTAVDPPVAPTAAPAAAAPVAPEAPAAPRVVAVAAADGGALSVEAGVNHKTDEAGAGSSEDVPATDLLSVDSQEAAPVVGIASADSKELSEAGGASPWSQGTDDDGDYEAGVDVAFESAGAAGATGAQAGGGEGGVDGADAANGDGGFVPGEEASPPPVAAPAPEPAGARRNYTQGG